MRLKRILHNEVIRTYCNFDGQDVVDLISTMKAWLEEGYQHGCCDLKLVADRDNKGYYNLLGSRMETEEEFTKRLKHEEAAAKKHKTLKEKNKIKMVERERKEYERLKTKYEKWEEE
jgi:hypothetical protein